MTMAAIDTIHDFEGHWQRLLAGFQKGDLLVGVVPSRAPNYSIQHAEARYLHRKFGSIRDPELDTGKWHLDWSDSDKPVVRLSADLFAHVADACEAA